MGASRFGNFGDDALAEHGGNVVWSVGAAVVLVEVVRNFGVGAALEFERDEVGLDLVEFGKTEVVEHGVIEKLERVGAGFVGS